MKTLLLLALFFILTFGLSLPLKDVQARPSLVGPILVGKPVGADWLTFEDVGTNKTWRVDLPNSSVMPVSWSPDGCNLLLRGGEYWGILSVANAELNEIHQAPYISVIGRFFGRMIWSFDGQSLTATVQLSESDARIYRLTPNNYVTDLILSLNTYGSPIRWLSETELLYRIDGGDYFVWDTVAKKSYLYKHKPQLHLIGGQKFIFPMSLLTESYQQGTIALVRLIHLFRRVRKSPYQGILDTK